MTTHTSTPPRTPPTAPATLQSGAASPLMGTEASLADVNLKLAQAYTSLICNYPFFATLLFRLKRICDPTAPTMWTDGTRLGYNPDFVRRLSQDELVGVLAHEVCHVAGLHPWRRGMRHPEAWNIACDQVVNQIVLESKLVLPGSHIPPVAGKSAEELYQAPPPGGSNGKQGQGQGPGQGAGKGKGKGKGQGDPKGDPNAPNNDPGGTGEVRDPAHDDGSPLSEAEREQQMNETKISVQQALNAAKRAGTLPAGLKRWADDLLEPKVPWREVLSRFVDSHSRHDYSWTRPNRRYVQSGLILPSLWSETYGEIVMGCDTSGSMGKSELREVCSEVIGALETYAERGEVPEITIAWFDHAVYEQTVSDPDDMLQPQGGGGTSFRVVFEWLAETREPLPKAIIMVTDGCCSDFGDEPAVPVLWVLTGTNASFTPPFGEITCVLNEE